MAISTPEQIEKAYELLEVYNKDKDPNYHITYIIDVGEKRKMHTLWRCNRLAKFKPYSYIRNVDDNILDAVKKLTVDMTGSPAIITIDSDQTRERAIANEWKVIKFGKYEGTNIDDLLDIDLNYCYYLYKKASDKASDFKQRKYMSKLDSYVINLYGEIKKRYEEKRK